MNDASPNEITKILKEWSSGEDEAKERLLQVVYSELRRHARRLMSAENVDHTLQPTALVHEAMLRLGDAGGIEWKDRRHFFGIVSRLMRQVLIDHARQQSTAKRGDRPVLFSLDDVSIPLPERAASLIALDESLAELERIDKQQSTIVELKFFGGLSNREIAEYLDISERTVNRDWQSARLWLFRSINGEN